MKRLMLGLFLFALCSVVLGQSRHVKNDTTFLFREINKKEHYYHAIYIERNKESASYKRLLDFQFDKDENKAYKREYEGLKQNHPEPLKKVKLSGLPKEWMPIYLYKGKYYIYSPSEWADVDRRIISDSTLLYSNFEISIEPFIAFKKTEKYTYLLKTRSYYPKPHTSQITIHIIDPKNKIAVWCNPSLPVKDRYGLYVVRDCAKNFDMVDNYFSEGKMPEFMFDKINYAKLLKGK